MMKFTKMQGAGNDFIIIDNLCGEIPEEEYSSLAKTLCRRRFSIGGDGVMFVEPPEDKGDYKMAFYNSDGSLGEMCGNGARCIARYGYEKGLAGERQYIETTAGMVVGKRLTQRNYQIRLNDISVMVLNCVLPVDDQRILCDYVEMGEPGLPHGAVQIDDLVNRPKESLRCLGQKLRAHERFPKGINVNFYDIVGEDELVELTYERGVEDFTLACGTGTASVVSILKEKGKVSGRNVLVHVPGGELRITIEEDQSIYLTGETKKIAEGIFLNE